MVDGSLSITEDEFILEQQSAKDTVAAFARQKIFDNGGTASYLQFSGTTYDEGTFDSPESFNAHVDSVVQTGIGTDIADGTHPLFISANGRTCRIQQAPLSHLSLERDR